jgi:hypothetical protein
MAEAANQAQSELIFKNEWDTGQRIRSPYTSKNSPQVLAGKQKSEREERQENRRKGEKRRGNERSERKKSLKARSHNTETHRGYHDSHFQ